MLSHSQTPRGRLRLGASGIFRAVARLGAEQIIILGHHPDGSRWRKRSAPPTS